MPGTLAAVRYLIATTVLIVAVVLSRPAAAAPSCASLGGTIEAGQMCHVNITAPSYTINMMFPADYPDQQALTDYLTQTRDGFVNVAQTSGRRDRQPLQMEATAEQHTSVQPRTRGVVLKFFQDLGGAHPSSWYKAFNYNLAASRPITFDNLFAPGIRGLDSIFPLVQGDLERRNGAQIPPSIGLDPSHYQNFAITDDQLIFYFAPGEMLPTAAGPTQVTVPRNALPPLSG